MDAEPGRDRAVDRADAERQHADDGADQDEVHAVAVELRRDDVGEADDEGDREVDAADDDGQRLADAGDGEQAGEHQHRPDREGRRIAGDQQRAEDEEEDRDQDRPGDARAGRVEGEPHRCLARFSMRSWIAVSADGDDQDRAVGDLEHEGRDVEQRQHALDQEDADRADRGAEEPAAAAGEADPAERHRRDRDQRVGRRDVGVGRADQRGQHQPGDAGEDAGDHVGQEADERARRRRRCRRRGRRSRSPSAWS